MDDDRQFYTEEFPEKVKRFERHLAEFFEEELEVTLEGEKFRVDFDEGYLEFEIGDDYFAVEEIIVSEYELGLGSKIMSAVEDFCLQTGSPQIIARSVDAEAIDFWEQKVGLENIPGTKDWGKEV